MDKKIEVAPVARDEYRFWTSPDLPGFDEGDGDKCRAWGVRQQIKVQSEYMENDASGELNDRFLQGEIEAMADWEPTSPEPDWFLLTIYDTEDSPVAWFASRAATAFSN